jgi:hypothetical protein
MQRKQARRMPPDFGLQCDSEGRGHWELARFLHLRHNRVHGVLEPHGHTHGRAIVRSQRQRNWGPKVADHTCVAGRCRRRATKTSRCASSSTQGEAFATATSGLLGCTTGSGDRLMERLWRSQTVTGGARDLTTFGPNLARQARDRRYRDSQEPCEDDCPSQRRSAGNGRGLEGLRGRNRGDCRVR